MLDLKMIQSLFMVAGTSSENLKISIISPERLLWEGELKNLLDAADKKNLKARVGGLWPEGWNVVEITRKPTMQNNRELPKHNSDIVVSII